jgi:hypothetical protein
MHQLALITSIFNDRNYLHLLQTAAEGDARVFAPPMLPALLLTGVTCHPRDLQRAAGHRRGYPSILSIIHLVVPLYIHGHPVPLYILMTAPAWDGFNWRLTGHAVVTCWIAISIPLADRSYERA